MIERSNSGHESIDLEPWLEDGLQQSSRRRFSCVEPRDISAVSELELLIEVSKLAGLTAPSPSESLKPLFSDDVVDTPLLAAELMEED